MRNLAPRHTVVTSAFGKLVFCLMIGALTGCSGGGAGPVGNTNASTPSAYITVSGTAATGLPLAGATVDLKDATGTEISTTTDASGNYVFNVAGRSAPFLLRACGTVNGQRHTY